MKPVYLEIHIDMIDDLDKSQEITDDISELLKKYGYGCFSCESGHTSYGITEKVRYLPKETF